MLCGLGGVVGSGIDPVGRGVNVGVGVGVGVTVAFNIGVAIGVGVGVGVSISPLLGISIETLLFSCTPIKAITENPVRIAITKTTYLVVFILSPE